jgi:mRNA-degrading endonuclease YafQ of YafQ-DinJ toxin-antitoxin module
MVKSLKKPIKNVDVPYLLSYWADVPADAARIWDSNVKHSDFLQAVSTAGDYAGSAILAHAMCEWMVEQDADAFWARLEQGRPLIGLALDVLRGATSDFLRRAQPLSDLIHLRKAPTCLLAMAILLDDPRAPELAEKLLPFLVRDDTGSEALDALALATLLRPGDESAAAALHAKVTHYLAHPATKDMFKGDFKLALAVSDQDVQAIQALRLSIDEQFAARMKDHKTTGMLSGLSWLNQVEFDLLATCIFKIYEGVKGDRVLSSRAVPTELWQSR